MSYDELKRKHEEQRARVEKALGATTNHDGEYKFDDPWITGLVRELQDRIKALESENAILARVQQLEGENVELRQRLADAREDANAEHAGMERWREDYGNVLRELAELRAALAVVDDTPIADWLSKFPQGTQLEIAIVFPGEYRIGYRYKHIHYLPATPHFYQLGEAIARCYHRFGERFPDEVQP